VAAIVCLGIAVRDLVFRVASLPPVAQKTVASAFLRDGGGMAATAAVAAAALGGTVSYWGRLGDDATGRELGADLESHGVRVRCNAVPGTQTPISAVLVADDGERMLTVYPGRLDESADWLPLRELAGVQAVHADFRWLSGATALFAAAAQRGIARVLDADAGDPQAVRALLPLADHAIVSQSGLAELSGHSDVEAGLRALAPHAPGVVAATLGAQGSVFLVDGALHRIPAPAVAATDTNGAGDVFHGAYALALAEGKDVIAAARFASVAAALKCRNGSGWKAAPARAEVETLLKEYRW